MPEDVEQSHRNDISGLALRTARFAEFRLEPHCHLDRHIALVASGVQRKRFAANPFCSHVAPFSSCHRGKSMTASPSLVSHTPCKRFAYRPHCSMGLVTKSAGSTIFPRRPLWDCKICDGKLRSSSLCNPFWSHRAEDGVAVIKTDGFESYVAARKSYLAFFLTRFAISFIAPARVSHKDEPTCILHKRLDRTQLITALDHGTICEV